MSQDFTHRLRELMQAVGFLSFKALSRAADVSEQQIRYLRRGETANLRVATLLKLSQTLQVPVTELIAFSDQESAVSGQRSTVSGQWSAFSDQESAVSGQRSTVSGQQLELKTQNLELKTQNSATLQELSDLKQEYDRLQQQLTQQRQTLWQEFQQTSIQTLESLLLQLPTAAYAAQQNPQAPAIKLLPLLRPLDRLLDDWGLEAIAPVGAEIPYDPQYHQLMSGTAQTGDQVRVRYIGYRHGDRLLYRAKVSPIA